MTTAGRSSSIVEFTLHQDSSKALHATVLMSHSSNGLTSRLRSCLRSRILVFLTLLPHRHTHFPGQVVHQRSCQPRARPTHHARYAIKRNIEPICLYSELLWMACISSPDTGCLFPDELFMQRQKWKFEEDEPLTV